jgi:hypothetical protein
MYQDLARAGLPTVTPSGARREETRAGLLTYLMITSLPIWLPNSESTRQM